MLTSNHHESTKGFTIVELLIVIVVIGILAAITIVAYRGVQNRASDSVVQSDLRELSMKMEQFKVDSTNENYPTSTPELETLNFSASKDAYMLYPTTELNLAYCKDSASKKYAVVGLSKSGKAFIASNGSVTATDSIDVAGCGGITGIARLVSGYYSTGGSGNPWRTWASR